MKVNNNIMSKQELGQFYTTNYGYILQDFHIPEFITKIIEPFAGEGHLTTFAISQLKTVETVFEYDIDPKTKFIPQRDTLLNPPQYKDYYIITNPPYLARNKSADKKVYDKYNENDLYKCFLKELLTNQAIGGLIIIPLNFFSSIRKADIQLRNEFVNIYNIKRIRIFEEQVFDDTSYTVCVVQFINKTHETMSNIISDEHAINVEFYPTQETCYMTLNKSNMYTFGGHMFCLEQNANYSIERLTKKNKTKQHTNLLLKCIDDSQDSQLGLYYKEDIKELFIDETENLSARAYATLIINPPISQTQQQELATRFNEFMRENRTKYHSLFLTNYRESKNGFARKRLSMSHGYEIVNYLLKHLE